MESSGLDLPMASTCVPPSSSSSQDPVERFRPTWGPRPDRPHTGMTSKQAQRLRRQLARRLIPVRTDRSYILGMDDSPLTLDGYCGVAEGHPFHGPYHDSEYGFPVVVARSTPRAPRSGDKSGRTFLAHYSQEEGELQAGLWGLRCSECREVRQRGPSPFSWPMLGSFGIS